MHFFPLKSSVRHTRVTLAEFCGEGFSQFSFSPTIKKIFKNLLLFLFSISARSSKATISDTSLDLFLGPSVRHVWSDVSPVPFSQL